MIDVDASLVVVLQRSPDCHIVEPIEVEVQHRCDGRTEASPARLVAIARALGATQLVFGLQGELVLKLTLLVEEQKEKKEKHSK